MVRSGGITAHGKRAGRVDQVGEVVDCRVLVVPESISRVTELSSKSVLQILGDSE